MTLNFLFCFLDNTTATRIDMRIVTITTTKIASTTAATTLACVPPLLSEFSFGIESVGASLLVVGISDISSESVESAGIELLVLGSGSVAMGSSVVGPACSVLVGSSVVAPGVVGSSVVGSDCSVAVVGTSIAIVVVGGGVVGHGGGVGMIIGQLYVARKIPVMWY